jgi:hypothetical protein
MEDQRTENLKSFLDYLERIESDIDKLQVLDTQVNLDTFSQNNSSVTHHPKGIYKGNSNILIFQTFRQQRSGDVETRIGEEKCRVE